LPPKVPPYSKLGVMVPRLQIDPRSTVRRVGDRGTLVVPRWLAQDLGIA